MNQPNQVIGVIKEALVALRRLQASGQTAGGQLVQELLTEIRTLLPDALPIPILTYPGAVEYFIDHCPDHICAVKGVILCHRHAKGYVVTQVFVTHEHALLVGPDGRPYGRRLLANRLDEQLTASFDNADCIIVE